MAARTRTHDPPKLGWSNFPLQPHITDLGLMGDEGLILLISPCYLLTQMLASTWEQYQ